MRSGPSTNFAWSTRFLGHGLIRQRALGREGIDADIADTVRDDPFRVAFVRLENEQGLYQEITNGVTFLTPLVFRAAIPLPANVPTGTYGIATTMIALMIGWIASVVFRRD